MAIFDDIVGQDLALTVLRRALSAGAAHAYLFTGPSGVGKGEAAVEFAAALTCPDGGCGECDCCRRVREGIHPDVDVLSPEGTFITVDQIREINREVALRPFEARVRVYVILEAESMNVPAANAFLRTLEEPPPHAHFVLVSSQPEELLDTIVSRCQRVPFRRTPAPLLGRHLSERFGLSEIDATAFARVAQGDLAYGRRLASDPMAREWRLRLIEWARSIPGASTLDAENMLDEIFASVERQADARVEALDARKEADLGWAADARTRARVEKLHDQKVKRERRRAVNDGLEEVMRTLAGWYRDLAAAAMGADEAVLNHDYAYELQSEAFPGRVEAYVAAIDCARRATRRFRYNVDARCALEDMVLSIKEALL